VVAPSRSEEAPILVIAATDLELAPLRAARDAVGSVATAWGEAPLSRHGDAVVATLALGLGKANTAAGLTAALLALAPRVVVQIGIGGAYLGSFLSVGLVAVATEEVDLELGVREADGWRDLASLGFSLTPALGGRPPRGNVVPTHEALAAAIARLAGAVPARFATLDAVTGDVDVGAALARDHGVAVESMEGVAAALVCDRLAIPFAEVRGVSNVVGERDRRRWNVRAAASAAADAVRTLLRHPEVLPQTAGSVRTTRW
jgi:futalosine hydrolase